MTPATTIITGGTGGIGQATARTLLASDPARSVALVDLSAGDVPEDLTEFGDRVAVFGCDVTDPDSVAAAHQQIRDRLPEVDGLVAGAGIVHNDASLDLALQTFHRMLAVHLDGTLLWCQTVGRDLIARGGGAIVTIGSIAGLFGHPRRLAYGAAKAAIISMTKTLAVEWASANVRVNAVVPGYIETPMMREVARIGLVDSDVAAGWTAMKRLGTPEEVAKAVAFLLSDASSYTTGHLLSVDGGFAVLKAE